MICPPDVPPGHHAFGWVDRDEARLVYCGAIYAPRTIRRARYGQILSDLRAEAAQSGSPLTLGDLIPIALSRYHAIDGRQICSHCRKIIRVPWR